MKPVFTTTIPSQSRRTRFLTCLAPSHSILATLSFDLLFDQGLAKILSLGATHSPRSLARYTTFVFIASASTQMGATERALPILILPLKRWGRHTHTISFPMSRARGAGRVARRIPRCRQSTVRLRFRFSVRRLTFTRMSYLWYSADDDCEAQHRFLTVK